MSTSSLSQGALLKMVLVRLVLSIPALGALFFWPAGTFDYWQAWVYLILLFALMLFILVYFMKNDPAVLERRMRMKEKESEQSLLIKLSYLPFLLAYLLPGFDRRFGWSQVPVWLVIVADLLFVLGYIAFFLVLRENHYASRVIEVEKSQTVITTGPYALVRHPMYSGLLLMYIFSPLALGSYWAVIPALLVVPIIIARIGNEESVLQRDLKGYTDYMKKTRYRLLPGIW